MSFRVFYLLSYHLNEPFRLFYGRKINERTVQESDRVPRTVALNVNAMITNQRAGTQTVASQYCSRKCIWTTRFLCCFVFKTFIYISGIITLYDTMSIPKLLCLWSEKTHTHNLTPTITIPKSKLYTAYLGKHQASEIYACQNEKISIAFVSNTPSTTDGNGKQKEKV